MKRKGLSEACANAALAIIHPNPTVKAHRMIRMSCLLGPNGPVS
jgi:hypothetical protein